LIPPDLVYLALNQLERTKSSERFIVLFHVS
jgi:hypothetical protein